MGPPKTASRGSGGSCDPPSMPRYDPPPSRGVSLCSPRVGARSGVGLGMGCSGSRFGVQHPAATRAPGRQGEADTPQGKERGCLCCGGGAIRAAP